MSAYCAGCERREVILRLCLEALMEYAHAAHRTTIAIELCEAILTPDADAHWHDRPTVSELPPDRSNTEPCGAPDVDEPARGDGEIEVPHVS
jgi:hypothetical protein